MAKRKILVAYETAPQDLEQLRALGPELEVVHAPLPTELSNLRLFSTRPRAELLALEKNFPRPLLDALSDAEIVYCLALPVDTLERAPRLRWIANMGSGTDQYQAFGLLDSKVVLTSSKGVAARTIAEFVMAQILSIAKRLPERVEEQRARRWRRLLHLDLHGLTIGIVGFGEIGSEIARMAKPFGMRVLATRRRAQGTLPENVDAMYPPTERVRMLAQCDVCAVTVALTPDTRGMVGRAELAAMRRGGILVDVSRGGVTDTGALAEALAGGQLRGAALDVFEQEPLPSDSPLWQVPNLFVTPHNAVGMEDYGHHAFMRFVENVRRYLKDEPLKGVVDLKFGY
jgi:phosphoglycerate dehydrogenase-like enzyme